MSETNFVKISNPSVKTWFIGQDNDRVDVKAYGSCDVNQTMRSPWSEIDYYTDEEDWVKVLKDNSILLND